MTDAAADVVIVDAAADVGTDSGANDAGPGPNDAAADAAKDAGPVDAGCAPPNGNFAYCGTASATSEYNSSYPASNVNDGVLDGSSWYLAVGSCAVDAGIGSCGTTNYVEVTLDQTRSIKRVKIFGNRGTYAMGYDTLTARIQLLSAANAVLATADVTTSRGAEPNGDVDHAFASVVAQVKKIRVLVLTGESDEPGIAEIEAYAN